MKKRLYLSIVAVLLPSVIYLIVFFLNDPHGYYKAGGNRSITLMDNMLDWRNGDYNALLIGDSRMTSFGEDYIRKLDEHTGYCFKNMSYGGAMVTETNYLTKWCLAQKPDAVKSIIIVTGWYNFNELLQQNRVKSTEKIIANPLSYAFSLNNIQDMFQHRKSSAPNVETAEREVSPEEKQEHFEIELKSMSKYLSAYKTDQTLIEELISICEDCRQSGIEIKIVIPPWVDLFYEELGTFGSYDMDEYKRELSNYVDIYDMEYSNCLLNQRYEDFSDYSHFHGKTYEDYSDELIYGDCEYARLWKNGIICTEHEWRDQA